jgi:uncharacterized protein YdiU (UPF0061 family)
MNDTNIGWNFETSYINLSPSFFKPTRPTPVGSPKIIFFNEALASELGLSLSESTQGELTNFLSGNTIPEGILPIAQAYAGHQFGNFTMLGDGRAILLGEHISPNKKRCDIQLKGPGRTPYSRGGDGRATLSAMLREYLISEAMNALGIPSTRSLAVTKTGEPVYREDTHEGAILTRIAKSHIRVGTFEYTYHFLNLEELNSLVKYTIARHYPQIADDQNPALSLLEVVMDGQIDLILHWMRVGFIHGVMNTDNMSIACETIDYGPCAFMNAYDPDTVFSSIDKNARYAFGNQPGIAHWNLACFANTLLPVIDLDQEKAIEQARAVLDSFPKKFETMYWNMLGEKIGFRDLKSEDKKLIEDLLVWMEENRADYTNTYLVLENDSLPGPGVYQSNSFLDWKERWKERIQSRGSSTDDVINLMQKTNPTIIPRNHKVEFALEKARGGSLIEFENLLNTIQNPYERQTKINFLDETPTDEVDSTYKTFCGT